MADEKLSGLSSTATTTGSYYETSIPDGGGGWFSRKILHSSIVVGVTALISTIQTYITQAQQTTKLKAQSVTFTEVMGSDVLIESIDLIYVSGSTTVKVGTSTSANDVISGRTITSVKNSLNPVRDYFIGATTLFFTLTGGGTIDVIINYRENYNS